MFPLFGGIGGMANPFGFAMNPMMSQIGMMALMRERMMANRESEEPIDTFNEQPVAPAEELLDVQRREPNMMAQPQQRMAVSGTLNLRPQSGGIATLEPAITTDLIQPPIGFAQQALRQQTLR